MHVLLMSASIFRDYMRDLDELHKSGAIRGTDIPD